MERLKVGPIDADLIANFKHISARQGETKHRRQLHAAEGILPDFGAGHGCGSQRHHRNPGAVNLGARDHMTFKEDREANKWLGGSRPRGHRLPGTADHVRRPVRRHAT